MFWHASVLPSVCPLGGGGDQSAYSARGGGQSSWGGQSSRGGSVQLGGGQSARGWVRSVTWVGGGSAKIGQQNEYSLHGGRYDSCVDAGGLFLLSVTSSRNNWVKPKSTLSASRKRRQTCTENWKHVLTHFVEHKCNLTLIHIFLR